jgi:MFS family permease
MLRARRPPAHDAPDTNARSLAALSWLNFVIAITQTGFGAFLAVYLTDQEWSRTDLGFVLSAGTFAAMAAQLPGGLLVDWAPSKRLAAAGAIMAGAAGTMLLAALPTEGPVLVAEGLQGAAAAVLTPAIAAITLALSRTETLGERLGRNVRYAAVGSVAAAAIMGLVGAWVSHRAIFWLATAAAIPALVALRAIHPAAIATAHERTSHTAAVPRHIRAEPPRGRLQVGCDRCLLTLAGCVLLFQLGNAALLPTAAAAVTSRFAQQLADVTPPAVPPGLPFPPTLRFSDLLVSAWIIVPQLVAALLSPWFGRLAQRHGRRIVLVLGFAALPVRAVLFATEGGPLLITCIQSLDGISGAAFGVIVPLVVADITHDRGHFNLALGEVGLAAGIGATLSTALAGLLADRAGDVATFLALAAAGLCGFLAVWFIMPETHRASLARPSA